MPDSVRSMATAPAGTPFGTATVTTATWREFGDPTRVTLACTDPNRIVNWLAVYDESSMFDRRMSTDVVAGPDEGEMDWNTGSVDR